jgi:hypothetical protein
MPQQPQIRVIEHSTAQCPACGKPHRWALRARAAAEPPVAMFGGPSIGDLVPVSVQCPTTGRVIPTEVSVPPGFAIVDQAQTSTRDTEPAASTMSGSPDLLGREFQDWIKASRATALDYCKTMLTTCTGAVPLYFALLKYLGHERSTDDTFSAISVIAPLLFLTGALLFAFAMTPIFGRIQPEQFAEFRESRLTRLNWLLRFGTALFAVAMLLTVLIAFGSLNRI